MARDRLYRRIIHSACAAGSCAAAIALLPASAHAQATEPQPADTAQAGAGERLDEIVVTARRRAESLQDVPIAVSAFNAGRIEDLQAKDLSGIQYAVPNLYLDKGDASNAVIYIRGVGQNDSLAFADPGVGVYVDDVFIARTQAAFLDLFDVERVEVLRGPQGTLYGRNTIGGAIKFVSTRPPKDFDAYLETAVGNYDYFNIKGRVGGPIAGDRLRAKAAFTAARRDGFNYNAFTGRDDGDLRTFSGRGALLFEATPDLEFELSVDGKLDRPSTSRSPVLRTSVTGATPGGLVTFPASDNPYHVNTDANGLSDLTAFGTALTARWNMSAALTLESITAWRKMDFDLKLDTDGAPLPLLDILLRQKEHQFSQELRLGYDDHGPLAFTAGLYYFHDDDVSFSGVDNAAATIFGFPVIDLGFASSSLASTHQVTDSYAAYGDATYRLSEQLSISAGLRYTHEERSSRRDFESFFDPGYSIIRDAPQRLTGTGVAGVPITGSASFDAFTPRFSISWQPARPAQFYASISRGFKSGGFDGRANNDFGFRPFRPEYVWSYETGAKTSWLDGRLIANAAVFYNDYTDIQVTSFGSDPVTGVFVSLFTNAAKARSYGIELELAAEPTDRLSLNASMGWLDARYRKFDQLVAGTVTDVSGRALVNAPRWNASVGGTYTAPLGRNLAAVLHLDGAYRSETATEITDSPVLRQPEYALLNGFVGLKSADNRWELRAGVQNLTDHAVRNQGFNLADFPGVQVNFYSAPRTYELRLMLRY